MMLTALAAAVAVGWLAGGSLTRLVDMSFSRLEMIIFAFGIQVILHLAPGWGLPAVTRWGFPLHLLSYALLLWALWENRHLPGMYVVGVGVLLNLAVIAANGGMPVCAEALAATGQQEVIEALSSGTAVIHQLMEADTTMAFLGDHLTTPAWFWRPTVYSPGDVVMVAGLLWLVPAAMRETHETENTEQMDGRLNR